MSEFKKIVSKILKISPNRINSKTSPANAARWDSFKGLLLVTEIERAYRVKFSMDEVLSIKDIGSIERILKSHDIDPNE